MKYKYIVKRIPASETYDWLLHKHYAKRIPSISYAFGLFDTNSILLGILTIGKPASNNLCIGVCGESFTKFVYELNRLIVNDGLEKNALSYFVASCLKLIQSNIVLVSYADEGMNHFGYIYQATNFVYTGRTKERTDIGLENNKHSRHYDKTVDYKTNRKFRTAKHRYIYFLGSKGFIKQAKNNLNYEVQPYPKGENKRYDASYQPSVQHKLF